MVLVGLFPTSGMTISWTGFARGNVAAALKMTVLGLLIVFVPMVAGVLTRKLLVHRMGPVGYKERAAKVFPGLSVVGVVAIVFLAIGLKADMIVADPGSLVIMLVPIVLFYLVSFALTTLLGRLTLTRGDAIAMVYGTVMRNLSIALGIAIAGFRRRGGARVGSLIHRAGAGGGVIRAARRPRVRRARAGRRGRHRLSATVPPRRRGSGASPRPLGLVHLAIGQGEVLVDRLRLVGVDLGHAQAERDRE